MFTGGVIKVLIVACVFVGIIKLSRSIYKAYKQAKRW